MMEFLRTHAQSWAVKALFGIIVIVFVFFGVKSFDSGQPDVVATVDGQAIRGRDFSAQYERVVQNLKRQNPQLDEAALRQMGARKDVLMQMVSEILIAREAKRLGITVTDAELAREIKQMPYFLNDRQQFDAALYRAVLQQQGYSVAAFERELRQELALRRLEALFGTASAVTDSELKEYFTFSRQQAVLDYVLFSFEDFKNATPPTLEEAKAWHASRNETFRSPPRLDIVALPFTPDSLARNETVTDDEVAAFHAKNAQRLYSQEERVRARHILLRLDQNATSEQTGAVLDKIKEIQAKLAAGEEFVALAQQYSEDTTAIIGGDLNWQGRGQFLPAFEAVAFSLQKGQVSEPVRTDFGYHLIKLEAREDARTKSLDEARPDILARLAREKGAARIADTLDQALDQVLRGAQFDAIGKDLDVPVVRSGLVTQEEAQARFKLEPEAAQALFLMDENEITDVPLELQDGFLLARVAAKKPAAVKPFEEVKDEVFARLREEQARHQAQAAAAALAEAIRAAGDLPKDKPVQVNSTAPFARGEASDELGANPDLLKAAFAAEPGKWLDTPFSLEDGFAVVRVKERLAPAADTWETEQQAWRDYLNDVKAQELRDAYLKALRDKAEVKLVNPALFE